MKVNHDVILELEKMSILLNNDFPSEDIERIENTILKDNDKYCLTGGFDSFCSLISGSLSYVLAHKKIPRYQRKLLYKDFFALYPYYEPLRKHLEKFPHFSEELKVHERVRELLLEVVKSY
ncbi:MULTISPECIES: YxiJ-like family protein [Anoxybacillus]|uniref:YxiJ-like family protein n=1 Tax=Anoxybacillus TaxID=150247 RepID=UPI000557FD01|nr:YxiJ-like family protein [Anoxybacillus flavithermus]AST06224.1 hypothetical protein AF2641_04705 [Anoxybacillus flavithermus]